nr:T-lymphocyte activation antigen CD80-like [Labrus bergylta]
MATRWIPENFLNQRLSLWVLCVLTVMRNVSGNENAAQIQLRGELGGNVSFSCPATQESLYLLYLQKGSSFVNGHYASKSVGRTWENTWMDQDKKTVHMHSLNVSHEGDYTCVIAYNEHSDTKETVVHLSIKANYSKPEVKVLHRDDIHWLVNCSSHGGYPRSPMIWNQESQMMEDVNSSVTRDDVTMTFNSSSTVYFNCSMGEIRSISCSVGGIDSQLFSVCKPKDRPPPTTHTPVIAGTICVALIFFIGIGLCLRIKCRRGQGGGTKPAGPSSQEEQGTPLTAVAVAS